MNTKTIYKNFFYNNNLKGPIFTNCKSKNLTFVKKKIFLCGINTQLLLYVIYIFLVDIQPIQS